MQALCLFYAEFDILTGPRIVFQTPEDFLSTEDFEKVADYMITKPELCGHVMSIDHPGLSRSPVKVVGYPVVLMHEKYQRNSLLFNVGFVLPSHADITPYSGVLRKLGKSFENMERDSEFLFRIERKSQIANVLPAILEGLNSKAECFVPINGIDTIALKLFPNLREIDPKKIQDYDVPVKLRDLDSILALGSPGALDMTIERLIPFIDGVSHVRALAETADIDISLVKRALEHLYYYGIITTVDIFQYSGIYTSTERCSRLVIDTSLRANCMSYVLSSTPRPVGSKEKGMGVSGGSKSRFYHSSSGSQQSNSNSDESAVGNMRVISSSLNSEFVGNVNESSDSYKSSLSIPPEHILRAYAAFGTGSRVCDVFSQRLALLSHIDERRFIAFGVMHGILKRVHKYPICSDSNSVQQPAQTPEQRFRLPDYVRAELDGTTHLDELCCRFGVSQSIMEGVLSSMGVSYILR